MASKLRTYRGYKYRPSDAPLSHMTISLEGVTVARVFGPNRTIAEKTALAEATKAKILSLAAATEARAARGRAETVAEIVDGDAVFDEVFGKDES